MCKVANFREIRRDGKIIDEKITTAEMNRLGWKVSKVGSVKWVCDSQEVNLITDHAFLSKVTPDRDYVFIKEFSDLSGYSSKLKVYEANGSLYREIPNTITINAQEGQGEFGWYEPARVDIASAVGVVFHFKAFSEAYESDYQIDIDAATGAILGTYEVR